MSQAEIGDRLTPSEGKEETDVKERVRARGVRHEGRDSVEGGQQASVHL